MQMVLQNLWYEISPNVKVDRISSGYSINGNQTVLRIRLDCEYDATGEF